MEGASKFAPVSPASYMFSFHMIIMIIRMMMMVMMMMMMMMMLMLVMIVRMNMKMNIEDEHFFPQEITKKRSVSDCGDRSLGDSAVQERMRCQIKQCPVTEDHFRKMFCLGPETLIVFLLF